MRRSADDEWRHAGRAMIIDAVVGPADRPSLAARSPIAQLNSIYCAATLLA
jgi:hypothetical protein